MLTVTEYLANGTSMLPALQSLLFTLAMWTGLVLVAFGLINLLTDGRQGATPIAATFAMLIMGSMLVSIFMFSDAIAHSLFQADAETYVVTSGITTGASALEGQTYRRIVFLYLVILGWFAVFRGMVTWAWGPKHNTPQWFSKGLVRVVAGVLLANFRPLANAVGATFAGTEFGTVYFSMAD